MCIKGSISKVNLNLNIRLLNASLVKVNMRKQISQMCQLDWIRNSIRSMDMGIRTPCPNNINPHNPRPIDPHHHDLLTLPVTMLPQLAALHSPSTILVPLLLDQPHTLPTIPAIMDIFHLPTLLPFVKASLLRLVASHSPIIPPSTPPAASPMSLTRCLVPYTALLQMYRRPRTSNTTPLMPLRLHNIHSLYNLPRWQAMAQG